MSFLIYDTNEFITARRGRSAAFFLPNVLLNKCAIIISQKLTVRSTGWNQICSQNQTSACNRCTSPCKSTSQQEVVLTFSALHLIFPFTAVYSRPHFCDPILLVHATVNQASMLLIFRVNDLNKPLSQSIQLWCNSCHLCNGHKLYPKLLKKNK